MDKWNNIYDTDINYMYQHIMFSGHMIQDLIDHYNVDMSLYTPSVQHRLKKRDFINLIAEMKIKYKDFPRIPDRSDKYSTQYGYGHVYEYK